MFNKYGKIKKIGLALIGLLMVVFLIANVRIRSVDSYRKQYNNMADSGQTQAVDSDNAETKTISSGNAQQNGDSSAAISNDADGHNKEADDAEKTGRNGEAVSTGSDWEAVGTGRDGEDVGTGHNGEAVSTGRNGEAISTGYDGEAADTGRNGEAVSTGNNGEVVGTGYNEASEDTGHSDTEDDNARYDSSAASDDTTETTGGSEPGKNQSGSEPGENQDSNSDSQNTEPSGSIITCTIEIRCDNAVAKKESIANPGIRDAIPDDGTILEITSYSGVEGFSVYDVLAAVTAMHNPVIPIVANSNKTYVSSINNLSEKNVGPTSGWTYRVNGSLPMMAACNYKVKDGDVIKWIYVCQWGDS